MAPTLTRQPPLALLAAAALLAIAACETRQTMQEPEATAPPAEGRETAPAPRAASQPASRPMKTRDENTAVTRTLRKDIPAIDRAAPAKVQTATFALG